MKNLKIIWTGDSHYCEDCGYSYAHGFKAYLDGELIDEFVPSAYCYDSDDISEEAVYKRLLEKLGFNVELEDEQ